MGCGEIHESENKLEKCPSCNGIDFEEYTEVVEEDKNKDTPIDSNELILKKIENMEKMQKISDARHKSEVEELQKQLLEEKKKSMSDIELKEVEKQKLEEAQLTKESQILKERYRRNES